MAYVPLPDKTEGAEDQVVTADETIRELLRQCLVELRKINLHLALVTDAEPEAEDVEEPE